MKAITSAMRNKYLVTAFMLLVVAAQPTQARFIRPNPNLFEIMSWGFPEFEWEPSSQYHKDVMEHFGRQFRCAQTCAEYNREIRKNSIANAMMDVQSERIGEKDNTVSGSLLAHTVKVTLPGVKSEDIQVITHGDTLSIKASRKWTKELIPEKTEEVEKCHCRDISEELLGKEETYSRQINLPTSIARDRIAVAWHKDTSSLVLTLPEKEPEMFKIDIVEVTSTETGDGKIGGSSHEQLQQVGDGVEVEDLNDDLSHDNPQIA
mmetsp:Transcript_16352/g.19605  ORF Transcript_16352/g.19605 Transcript_16352/m.19605 type:complete len:263 (+) Transcript_16352:132-920(+)|eukprot:jgi/Bigna1/89505/estExt_fgenesh1_pg.C_500091